MLERIPDGRGGQRNVASRQKDQREARLRIPPGVVSLEKRLLGPFDVALPQPDAAELRQRPAEFPSQVGAQLVAR